MRTTIRLPDPLYDRVRTTAKEEGVTVTAYIERALQTELTRDLAPVGKRYRIDPFYGRGLQPGVDLDDNSALADLMDGMTD